MALETYTNSIGMEFVLIPAGTFWMGSDEDHDHDALEDEKPRHEVEISRSFYLGRYTVTQAQWESVMGSNPSKFKGADLPVEMVSWDDVQEFIRKLNAQEGHDRYRLPTEAEWEYACRAGSTTAYCFGNDKNQLGEYAWYWDSSGKEMHPVGQKKPNAWGLYDMHGNVFEWVWDWYGEYYGSRVRDPEGPHEGEYCVLRGGSWFVYARFCRSASRSFSKSDTHDANYGFRLALSLEN